MSRTRSFAYSLAFGIAAIFLGCMWAMMFVAYGGSTSFEAVAVLGLFGLAVLWTGFSALRQLAYAFRPDRDKNGSTSAGTKDASSERTIKNLLK